MKRFVLNLLIVLLGIIAFDRTIGFYLDSVFSQSAFLPATLAMNNKYDIALFGASEMENQYVTNIIEDSLHMTSYNYGWGGKNIYFQYVLLNLMVNHSCHLPKYIIMEVQAIDFYDVPGYNTEVLNVFHPMYNMDDTLRSVVGLQGCKESILLNILRCYKHNSEIHNYAKQSLGSKDISSKGGFVPLESVSFTDDLEVTHDKADDVFDELKIDYFNRFIDVCKKNHIGLILVNAPYYELHEDIKWISFVQTNSEKKGIPFLNYDNDPYFTEHREFYYNRVHFNKYGAIEYTQRICSDLQEAMNSFFIEHTNTSKVVSHFDVRFKGCTFVSKGKYPHRIVFYQSGAEPRNEFKTVYKRCRFEFAPKVKSEWGLISMVQEDTGLSPENVYTSFQNCTFEVKNVCSIIGDKDGETAGMCAFRNCSVNTDGELFVRAYNPGAGNVRIRTRGGTMHFRGNHVTTESLDARRTVFANGS